MEHRFIYLVRHGEINPGGGKRFIGQTDLPLTEQGVLQAKRLQHELSCVKISQIYCSDMSRSITTAEIIGNSHNVAPTVSSNLREIHLGSWEGRNFEEIRRKFPEEFKKRGQDIVNYRPPEGESFADLSLRVNKVFDQILQETSGNIVIVGHAGVNRAIICHLLDMPLENLFKLSQDYGCLNIIMQGTFGYRLRCLNKIYKLLPY